MEQGKYYLFVFHKIIKSPEGTDYFVLIDPFGQKHLIPARFYTSYVLVIGQKYLCKVDKINCLGRVFIEPPHPFYKENQTYLFRYVKTVKLKHKSGNSYSFYQFIGKNGHNALMDAQKTGLLEQLKSGFQLFRVTKISKATIYIQFIP